MQPLVLQDFCKAMKHDDLEQPFFRPIHFQRTLKNNA